MEGLRSSSESELNSSGGSSPLTDSELSECARLSISRMLRGDDEARAHIEDKLAVNDDGQTACYECPVAVCEVKVNFELGDGSYTRTGDCSAFMQSLISQP